ncbi:hypothetical protein PoB_000131500 [Plakobranchus ocellatus]|uniref:Uncharacterized protein n=1 Tax=Plakobranchus ocellatus TaxID=259542 RepID=A0AAV3XVH3_9GAST|nr:hypothetical protein PoB_000131500 [Plakobranchus ocellatus]
MGEKLGFSMDPQLRMTMATYRMESILQSQKSGCYCRAMDKVLQILNLEFTNTVMPPTLRGSVSGSGHCKMRNIAVDLVRVASMSIFSTML